jgi:rhodanese-related sulfurtransferase
MDKNIIREISVQELNRLMQSNEPFQLIDVRELDEYQAANLGGKLIPIAEVNARQQEIDIELPTAILCRSGKRSAAAVLHLQQLGFENLYNVKGGILAFAAEINPSLRPI